MPLQVLDFCTQQKTLPTQLEMDHDTSICAACATMNLETKLQEADAFFTANDSTPHPFLLAKWRPRLSQKRASACGLCQLLRNMRNLDGVSRSLCFVAFPATQVLPFIRAPLPPQFRLQQQVVCALLTEQELQSSLDILRSSDPLSGLRIAFQEAETTSTEPSPACIAFSTVPSLVDFDRIRGWVDFCEINHRGVPCRSMRHPNAQSDSMREASLSGFHLIDTIDGAVVLSTLSEKFVALSYVWGGRAQQPSATSPWPKVVQDAVTATKALSFRYLWVNRHCIPEGDKHNQISRMDLIYRRAQLTIVATAGQDADYGLPGVSVHRPSSQFPGTPFGLRLMPPIDARDAVR